MARSSGPVKQGDYVKMLVLAIDEDKFGEITPSFRAHPHHDRHPSSGVLLVLDNKVVGYEDGTDKIWNSLVSTGRLLYSTATPATHPSHDVIVLAALKFAVWLDPPVQNGYGTGTLHGLASLLCYIGGPSAIERSVCIASRRKGDGQGLIYETESILSFVETHDTPVNSGEVSFIPVQVATVEKEGPGLGELTPAGAFQVKRDEQTNSKLSELLYRLSPRRIIPVYLDNGLEVADNGLEEGAACTLLLVQHRVDNGSHDHKEHEDDLEANEVVWVSELNGAQAEYR
ncbi:hypothetical protein ON010_g6346 [Phytophthora cinnamomi]|nr:hypothetical protein ON010_g6346 [Phytophthora cinnamomi]